MPASSHHRLLPRVCSAFLLSAFASSTHPLRATADDAQVPVSSWIRAAAAIRDMRVRFHGREVRKITESEIGAVAAQSGTEVTLEFEIEYLFARPDRESYSRNGTMLTDLGIKAYYTRRIVFGDNRRELNSGGEDSLRAYDQYVIRRPKPIHEPAIEPLRFLLNLDHTGRRAFFNACQFKLVGGTSQEINGVECVMAETPDNRGIRVWFEPARPNRIHKLEVDLAVAQRSGHVECIYRYSTSRSGTIKNADRGDEPVALPSEWQLITYSPHTEVRSWIICQMESAEINRNPLPDEFQLPVPPGAIVADRRAEETSYFLQLADGTQQPIPHSALGPQSLLALSSRVRGSRVENSMAVQRLEDGNGLWRRRGLFILNLAVVVLVGVVFAVIMWRRRVQ